MFSWWAPWATSLQLQQQVLKSRGSWDLNTRSEVRQLIWPSSHYFFFDKPIFGCIKAKKVFRKPIYCITVTWHFYYASLPYFTILTNPNHSHHHPPTPTTHLIIFGLSHYFCLVLHSHSSLPTPSYSTFSSSLPVPVGSLLRHPYQLQTLSQNLYHLSFIF